MEFTARRSAQIAATLLIAIVVTQLVYFALSSAGMDINRMIIWTTEAVAFLGISVFAMIPLARGSQFSAAWAAIAVGGMLNVIQVGMGLAMFGPVKDAGEAMAPAFQAILAGAFFLYFTGKFLFAAASIVIGLGLFREAKAAAKFAGVLAIVGGIAALLVNLYAMAVGMDAVFLAGATGTAATLFLGFAIIAANVRAREPAAVD
ncbi:MAG: hypothetical protein WA908_03710 [Pontixanthobacter sp.]